MKDGKGHVIQAGEKYAEVAYLEKKSQRGKVVKYANLRKENTVYIHVAEVAVTNIDVNEDLQMDISEYIYVSESTL